MSLTLPEEFIARNFGKMPTAVRVITYLTLLFLFVYTSLLPEFINGEIRIGDKAGEYMFYTLGRVSITIEGKDIITDTNDRGKWSLPLLTKMPRDQSIAFWYKDQNRKWKTFDIRFNGFNLIRGKHLVVYHNPDSSPKFYVKNEKTKADSSRVGVKGAVSSTISNFLNTSYAYDQVSNNLNSIKSNNIEKQVISVIKKTISNTSLQIHKNTHLFKDIKITVRDEINLKSNIESKFKIELSSREWSDIETVDDLVKLVDKHVRKSLTKVSREIGYAYYGIQGNDGKWTERYFENESREKTARPELGDIVKAIGNVNIRDGYIEYKFLRGWVNRNIIGLIKLHDRILVEEVKAVAGNFVWVKFRRIVD